MQSHATQINIIINISCKYGKHMSEKVLTNMKAQK